MMFPAALPTTPGWQSAASTPPVFAVIWSTGADPRVDRVFRLAAARRGPRGWERFDRFVDPLPDRADEVASARMVREFGVTERALAGALPCSSLWEQFRTFCGPGPIVAPDGERCAAWFEHFADDSSPAPVCIGLTELAALFFPGRMSLLGEGLVDGLQPAPRVGPRAAWLPEHLVAACTEFVRRFLEGDPQAVRLAAQGYTRAWSGLAAFDPPAAQRLAAALALVDRPSSWTGAGELFHGVVPEDGRLSAALVAGKEAQTAFEPRASVAFADWRDAPKLPAATPGAQPFMPQDLQLLDELFQLHLPAIMAAETGLAPERTYRAAQHSTAREVAQALGSGELLLVHAPTGTGKTMAYLLPLLLWARRHALRTGVATYTRALQEQALDREVPRALAALARAGVVGEMRISLLKGRENYLCFRSLCAHEPDLDDEAESWLTWTRLALFSLTDLDGDLDRFPRRAPIALSSEARHRAIAAALVRSVRCRSGCCEHEDDRATCAAEIARARAERSHLVLTNQSFVLARPEWLAHVVFDECEHLHEVAASAWSHVISLDALAALLARLHVPRTGSTVHARHAGALDRLARLLGGEAFADGAVVDALRYCQRAQSALAAFVEAAQGFERWRHEARGTVDARDEHALFRRYVESRDGDFLRAACRGFVEDCAKLEATLATLIEGVDALRVRGAHRPLRAVALARSDLVETIESVAAWLPSAPERPQLRAGFFYDLERDARGGFALVARILLPGDALGRLYYPALATGIFLSAAAQLRGSLDSAIAYLGLDRVGMAQVDEEEEEAEEEQLARPVRRATAPETFDYARVLVGTPRDVPSPTDKAAHLEYVSSFLLWLAERTRGRLLALFTSLDDVRHVAERLTLPFRERRLPLWFQGMDDAGKEELAERFRARIDSVLLGVDTFWYGADFPGETLEYLVIARLPYGVPDRFHGAQCAVLGEGRQRQRIYLPRALAKFRQGFGRLMRRESDRGCVFVLDPRITTARHRLFLDELPLARLGERGARLVRSDSTTVLREALAHMGMLQEVRQRGLALEFEAPRAVRRAVDGRTEELPRIPYAGGALPPPLDVPPDSLPF